MRGRPLPKLPCPPPKGGQEPRRPGGVRGPRRHGVLGRRVRDTPRLSLLLYSPDLLGPESAPRAQTPTPARPAGASWWEAKATRAPRSAPERRVTAGATPSRNGAGIPTLAAWEAHDGWPAHPRRPRRPPGTSRAHPEPPPSVTDPSSSAPAARASCCRRPGARARPASRPGPAAGAPRAGGGSSSSGRTAWLGGAGAGPGVCARGQGSRDAAPARPRLCARSGAEKLSGARRESGRGGVGSREKGRDEVGRRRDREGGGGAEDGARGSARRWRGEGRGPQAGRCVLLEVWEGKGIGSRPPESLRPSPALESASPFSKRSSAPGPSGDRSPYSGRGGPAEGRGLSSGTDTLSVLWVLTPGGLRTPLHLSLPFPPDLRGGSWGAEGPRGGPESPENPES